MKFSLSIFIISMLLVSTTTSSYVTVLNYQTNACKGNYVSQHSMLEDTCFDGVMYSCANNRVTKYVYGDLNCNGIPYPPVTTQVNECGQVANFASGIYQCSENVPFTTQSSIVNVKYNGTCQDSWMNKPVLYMSAIFTDTCFQYDSQSSYMIACDPNSAPLMDSYILTEVKERRFLFVHAVIDREREMDLDLIQTKDKFLVIPKQSNNKISQALEISKLDDKIRLTSKSDAAKEQETSRIAIQGIVGIVDLISGRYLIVFQKAPRVATVNGHSIYRVEQIQIIPFQANQQSLMTIPECDEEMVYLDMLKWMLNVESFYFSLTTDITHTQQRLLVDKPTAPDQRFFWNGPYVRQLQTVAPDYVFPIMLGFVKLNAFDHDGAAYTLTLISRRNLLRSGTRYNLRGADKRGNVANNVESEQIIGKAGQQDTFTSMVQIRGSVPLLWSQYVDLKYKPKVKFHGTEDENNGTIKSHFTALNQLYGKNITIVNLIDRKGDELHLGQNYEKFCSKLAVPPRYVWFDFHAICKGMRYDKLSLLIEEVGKDIDNYGFLHVVAGKVVAKQQGIFRVNCIDNLDRTNVVQSLFARTSLEKYQMAALKFPQTLITSSSFDHAFKNIWADNGDRLSTHYSGTGALKGDFTRTGKRNFAGVLRDGQNSVIRYYLNNFVDGFRQDAFDLFTGAYQINPEKLKNPKHSTPLVWVFLLLFFALVVYLFMIPTFSSGVTNFIYFIIYWFMIFFGVSSTMKRFNNNFIDRPKLLPLN
ncbi:putative phosphoinositide phosphatase [Cavenderia fasciculata]|uniref:Phosphoinositide phosphatase n=1 Tax=Cavenderia fasciculata TaxID=261658 RepID=F4PT30_CACFS|nr:putative phosphoinositide phosphatase [Cavenderia fasciculata]EGG21606.1 putative phosphoinositide phosphatase [Cavenderia fasciculata]|eukprot:XP_004359456.1 putative phosphoinositide phosphatase [Cavenderia fasciculata]